MIELHNWKAAAVEKLREEEKKVAGNKEKAMAGPVAAAMTDFCQQNAEFARRVAQGGSFADCMKKVAEGVGNYISDLDAYKKAVKFYFPEAEVSMQLAIRSDDTAPVENAKEPETGGIILNLSDFL